MPIKHESYHDNVGGGYPERERKTSVPLTKDASKMRFGNLGRDPLAKAFGTPSPKQPTQHHWEHSKRSQPRGALYHPMEEFGTPGKRFPSHATDFRPHYGIPGTNAVGNHSNRRGESAIGNPQNKRGVNALHNPSEMMGDNSIGLPNNRRGENALGGKMPSRGSFPARRG